MLILTNSGTDKLQLVSSVAADLDVLVSWTDLNGTTVTPGRTGTAVTTATTADIVATPGSSTYRNVKTITVRNKDATDSTDVTIVYNMNGTSYELYKVTLAPGEVLEWIEGIGFFKVGNTALLDVMLRVASDVVNATTSFADITGLTQTLLSGKKYAFEASIFHQTNATTTGAQFGVNIGATPTVLNLSGFHQITASVTAAGIGASAMVTAVDTAAVVETTGPGAVNMLAILRGFIQPSADGTFAMRCKSEVAVASGLTVKAGSWLHIRECNN